MIRVKRFFRLIVPVFLLSYFAEHLLFLCLSELKNILFFFDEHQVHVDLYYRLHPVVQAA